MSEYKNLTGKEAIDKMTELIEAEKICLFATSLLKLPLDARPMATAGVDPEGNIWFISREGSEKNRDIMNDNKVQLFYSNKSNSEYLNIYGEAFISKDRNKIEELWNSLDKAWFKNGKNDSEITLICVKPLDAHYWDTKSSRMISLIKIVASAVTGHSADDGVEGKIQLNLQK